MQREVDRQKYMDAYYKNEYDANKQMAFALLFSAILLTIIWLCFLVGLFNVTKETRILMDIVFPINIFILVSPMFYIKTDKIQKPRFKYFVLLSFVFVISVLNVIIPKHAIIGWAVCIVITNHYYNPKVGRTIFIISAISMLICIYLAMYFGEFDSNLLMGELNEKTKLIYSSHLDKTYLDIPKGRFEYLHDLRVNGISNRYLTAFVFYYLARVIFLTITFFVSYGLNKRTYKLLLDEIKVNSEQERTHTELEVAKEIQLQSLGKEFVTNEDIEIQAELKAARSVGGDFYDYIQLDKNHVGIIIGDVSGKGIGAAMYMMKTLTSFRSVASINRSPAETLSLLNKMIYDGEGSNMFVTCFYAIINTHDGLMRYANAGHTRPIVGLPQKYHYLKCLTGFVLGGLEDAYVVDEEYHLNPGEIITLYTDGITEARNSMGEFYGEKRLLDLYNKKEYSCLVELHADLKDDLLSFSNGEEQSDDITYLTLKYHGDKYSYEEESFEAKLDKVPLILQFMRQFAEKKNVSESFINNLLVVGDEMLSNICKYAYTDELGDIYLRLLYNHTKQEFIITIIDTGIAFNPFLQAEQKVKGDVTRIKEGGLGILIVKKLMSEYAYDRINNKNIITLKKKF